MDGKTKLSNNKTLVFILTVMLVLIIGLIVGIVLAKSNDFSDYDNNDGNGNSQNNADESKPVLSESEIVYNKLEEFAASNPDTLRETTISYCKEKIAYTDIDNSFNILTSCVLFMIDHDYLNEAVEALDEVNKDDLTTSQLIILYDYYSVAYDKLGNTEKSTQYEKEYQRLKETVKERERP